MSLVNFLSPSLKPELTNGTKRQGTDDWIIWKLHIQATSHSLILSHQAPALSAADHPLPLVAAEE